MGSYWALRLFTKWGTAIALVSAVLVPSAAVAVMLLVSWNWFAFAVAIGVGVLCGFLIKVFSELAQVIVEMLLPVSN
jgi:hypothetical protein